VSVSLVPLLVREADVPAAARALDLDPNEARALVGLPENLPSYIHVNEDRKEATP
jgi:hypothetical protein